jgi:heme-degrading monooxygenase HmoA
MTGENKAVAQPPVTPEPPYYAVIFTSRRRVRDGDGYDATTERMEALAAQMPGFLGLESARAGLGITVCYWRDEESIARWKAQAEHELAQQRGRQEWYEQYTIRVARVERAYGFDAG